MLSITVKGIVVLNYYKQKKHRLYIISASGLTISALSFILALFRLLYFLQQSYD